MTDSTTGFQPGLYNRIQEQVYILLESQANDNKARKLVIYFIAAVILLNVFVVILETEYGFYAKYEPYFLAIDLFCVIVFSVEYIHRLWVCVRNPRYSSPVTGRIRYAVSPLALIDLIAIAPFYLPMIFPIELRLLRLLRLLRIFRVLKLGRYSYAFETFADVLKSKKEELIITIIMVVIILILASSALYVVESEAQPDKFSSIPDAMWWAVITLATVGYGDVYPVTPVGKFVSSLVALSAIGLFALPAGILAAGFAESIEKRCTHTADQTLVCPNCGTELAVQEGMELPDSKTGGKSDGLKK
jgi:voltage-gated potassium channel